MLYFYKYYKNFKVWILIKLFISWKLHETTIFYTCYTNLRRYTIYRTSIFYVHLAESRSVFVCNCSNLYATILSKYLHKEIVFCGDLFDLIVLQFNVVYRSDYLEIFSISIWKKSFYVYVLLNYYTTKSIG